MIIKYLELKNFRNYKNLRLDFDPGTTVFFGDNGQGKTNILEAMYLCGTTKSHRGNKDHEMILFQEDEAHIRMEVERRKIPHRIDMHLVRDRAKGVAIDSQPIKRASELFGFASFVFFSPEDLNIIKKGPVERRRFLDREISQVSRFYLNTLSNYNKVVLQRNKLLKEISFHPALEDTLDVWDDQMVLFGKKLLEERLKFTALLNEEFGKCHQRISGGRETVFLKYEPDVTADNFEEKLKYYRERDLKFRLSATGPHRDDFSIFVNGADIRKYGSQGQQRTAALSLKLSEIDLIRKLTKETPVLLLDDVLSELDESRQKYILNRIGDIQTFITCTGAEEFLKRESKHFNMIRVTGGTAEKY